MVLTPTVTAVCVLIGTQTSRFFGFVLDYLIETGAMALESVFFMNLKVGTFWDYANQFVLAAKNTIFL